VDVGIDEAWNDPPAGQVQLTRFLGELEAHSGADRLDVSAANYDYGIGKWRSAGTVNEGGA
jgi:hypothetical protein